ncbi:hypothetical protein [Kitasatospora sp. MMS16-BH015]|uniref:hypothetical protein n=1 Tax=Kitasatospora sp. MMS16-BH015 TaxID=2018025 RepID=UPI001C2BBF35|nr:hypothetical protein [Kitasatospora sp. MMS16-BH015]
MTQPTTTAHPARALRELGGHAFGYESAGRLVRCAECGAYEGGVSAADGTVTPCTGFAGYGGDHGRVYLLVTVRPELRDGWVTPLIWRIEQTGLARTPQYPWRDGQLLVESAPSVVEDLANRIRGVAFDLAGRSRVPAAAAIRQLSEPAGRAVLEANRAAYLAEEEAGGEQLRRRFDALPAAG